LLNVINTAIGGAPGMGELALLRRLFVECHTLSMSDLKNRVERGDDAQPRRVLFAERVERAEAQKARLPGFQLEGELEPSHCLLDEVEQQREDGHLKHITVDRCGSRQQELAGLKRDPKIKLDLKDGSIRISTQDHKVDADVSSDLRIRNAFTRRSLAYDQSALMTFGPQMEWVDHLFSLMHQPALDNFQVITMAQCMNADRRLFEIMAENTKKSIKADLAGIRPLDEAMKNFRNDARVNFLLLPLPGGAKDKKPQGEGKEKDKPWWVKQKEEKQKVKQDEWKKKDPKGKGKGKEKGKNGKGAKSSGAKTGPASCPDELKGMVQADDEGNFLCWNFNLSCGCPHAKPGARCRRGRHICCKPGCGGNHSLQQCTSV
jgi:hypothetical protein